MRWQSGKAQRPGEKLWERNDRRRNTPVCVEPGSPSAFADAVLRLLDDEVARERLAAAGRDRVREFSFTRTAQQTLAVFVASASDIDAGMKLGCGHPMGPLELLDFVGLDATLYIADIMFGEFKDIRYAAPPLLRRMVAAGMHGRKSGRGFYEHAGK